MQFDGIANAVDEFIGPSARKERGPQDDNVFPTYSPEERHKSLKDKKARPKPCLALLVFSVTPCLCGDTPSTNNSVRRALQKAKAPRVTRGFAMVLDDACQVQSYQFKQLCQQRLENSSHLGGRGSRTLVAEPLERVTGVVQYPLAPPSKRLPVH